MANENLQDRIGDLFSDRTIFVSGASGFVGKALVEKILRETNVKRIYLIRNKKEKSPEERLQDIFSNVLFKLLLSQKPNIIKKCVPISGDITEVDLGISKRDQEILKNEVNFIFHSAATTRFDLTVKSSIIVNTRGTKYMVELAEQCKNLQLFIHISTAYAFPLEQKLLEKEYVPNVRPYEVLNSLNWIQEDSMSDITKRLLGNIPNSYTFSKSLAEVLLYERVGKIPIIICRPALVIPSFEDPFPGWFQNLQGPMGLFVGAGKGVIRSMYMDSKSYANLVPVDATVSSLMVFSWYYLTNKNSPYIFNCCVPQSDIRVTWEDILETGRTVIERKVPFNGILWYPGGSLTKYRLYAKINFILFQLIPAIIIDTLLYLLGYKPILYSIQMRIKKGAEMFEFYTTKAWEFETTNVETIREKLTDFERKRYLLKSSNIDVAKYLENCMLSCRRHILKETDDRIPAAKRNMKIMYCLDRFFKSAFFLGVIFCIYWLLHYLNTNF